ncbi:hypothetical protein NFI96_024482, partial [Prochilodus magdalenae]
ASQPYITKRSAERGVQWCKAPPLDSRAVEDVFSGVTNHASPSGNPKDESGFGSTRRTWKKDGQKHLWRFSDLKQEWRLSFSSLSKMKVLVVFRVFQVVVPLWEVESGREEELGTPSVVYMTAQLFATEGGRSVSHVHANGFCCVPAAEATVEDVLLAVGERVGHEHIYSASRMNKAVVVFLKDERLVNQLVESGIWVFETFVPVSPLLTPATKVTISNVPPFLPRELLAKELGRFGKLASAITMIPLGCKNAALKHVLSFRRQVFMFLTSPDKILEVSFRVPHGDSSYMVYVSTDSLRCFECGDIGHKHFACPLKDRAEPQEDQASTSAERSGAGVEDTTGKPPPDPGVGLRAAPETGRRAEVSERLVASGLENEGSTMPAGQGECGAGAQTGGDGGEVSEVTDSGVVAGPSAGGFSTVAQDSAEPVEPEAVSESQSGSVVFVEEEMEEEEEDRLSEISDAGCSQFGGDVLYTVDQINPFLDETKGRSVEVRDFFPDLEKFVCSVLRVQKNVGYDVLSRQKRFRLKKLVTAVRKAKSVKAGSRACSDRVHV